MTVKEFTLTYSIAGKKETKNISATSERAAIHELYSLFWGTEIFIHKIREIHTNPAPKLK